MTDLRPDPRPATRGPTPPPRAPGVAVPLAGAAAQRRAAGASTDPRRPAAGTRVDGGPPRAAATGRELLRGTPQEVLARLAHGDPLELRPRVRRALRRRRLLFDESRALLRAVAVCARHAGRYRGRPALTRWLDARVELALDTLLAAPAVDPPSERERALAARLGLDAAGFAAARARFHRLPFPVRDAFFQLVLDGRSLDDLVHPGGRSAVELARDARRALAVLLAPCAAPPEPETPEPETLP